MWSRKGEDTRGSTCEAERSSRKFRGLLHKTGLMRAIMTCLILGGRIPALGQSANLFTVYSFSALSNGNYGTNADGAYPYAALIQARDGNFYGTTFQGGASGEGT